MNIRSSCAAALAFACLVVSPAAASSETDEALAKVRAIGKVWNGEVNAKTRDIYLPLLRTAPKDGVTLTKDVAYGPDARHRLDVFEPAARPARPMPVAIYVHGGGLTGGNKDSPGTPGEGLIYANVGQYFARHGMLGINATYRLVPGIKFPEGAQDIAAAVRWARANAARHGGDPNAIFLIGHSAGGTHVAGYLYSAAAQGAEGPQVAGAVLLSPAVGAETTGPREATARAYYGDDPANWISHSPIGLYESYSGRKVPTSVIVAEFDPTMIEAPAAELMAKICLKDKACPHFVNVRGHNHISSALSLNTGDQTFGPILLDFIRGTLATRGASQ